MKTFTIRNIKPKKYLMPLLLRNKTKKIGGIIKSQANPQIVPIVKTPKA